MNIDDFVKIGTVGVDSGQVMFVDPCYVLPRKEYDDAGQDYQSILDFYVDTDHYKRQVDGTLKQYAEPWGEGLGIVTGTTDGDGVYKVYGRFNERGVITQVLVDFTGEVDYEDDEWDLYESDEADYDEDTVEPDTYDDEAF